MNTLDMHDELTSVRADLARARDDLDRIETPGYSDMDEQAEYWESFTSRLLELDRLLQDADKELSRGLRELKDIYAIEQEQARG